MSRATNWGVQTEGPANMAEVSDRANETFDALLSSHKGAGRPTYAVAGTFYIADDVSPWQVRVCVNPAQPASADPVWATVDPGSGVMTLAGVSIGIADVSGLQAALDARVPTSRTVNTSGLATGGGSLAANRTISVPIATQQQAEGGVDSAGGMNALRTAQAIAAQACIGRQTISAPAAGWTIRADSGIEAVTELRANHGVIERGIDFAPGVHRYCQAQIAMPKGWDAGPLQVQFLWTAHSGSGNVIWGVQGLSRGDGDGIDAAWGDVREVTDTLQSTGSLHITAFTANLVLSGSPAQSDMIWLQIYRAGSSGSDTLNANARLLSVRILYTINAGTDD